MEPKPKEPTIPSLRESKADQAATGGTAKPEETITERKPLIVKPQETRESIPPTESVVEKAPALKQQTIRKRQNAYADSLAAPPRKALARIAVTTVAPGEPIPFSKLDVLFIHAHPDDEALDFERGGNE